MIDFSLPFPQHFTSSSGEGKTEDIYTRWQRVSHEQLKLNDTIIGYMHRNFSNR